MSINWTDKVKQFKQTVEDLRTPEDEQMESQTPEYEQLLNLNQAVKMETTPQHNTFDNTGTHNTDNDSSTGLPQGTTTGGLTFIPVQPVIFNKQLSNNLKPRGTDPLLQDVPPGMGQTDVIPADQDHKAFPTGACGGQHPQFRSGASDSLQNEPVMAALEAPLAVATGRGGMSIGAGGAGVTGGSGV